MMNLALMNRFFQTVDTEGCCPIADAFLERWSINGPVRHQRSSENFAWAIGDHDNATHFLRFNHATERTVAGIEGEIAFVRHLAQSDLPVAQPVISSAGHFVETVDTGLGTFHGSVFTALHGEEPDAEELDLPSLEHWGNLVARVHQASEGFCVDGRPSWSEAIIKVRRTVPRDQVIVHRELDDVEQRLSSYAITDPDYGLIHADIDNCVWRDGAIDGIMDFDDCLYCWYEADIVSALVRLFDNRLDRINLEDERLGAFLKGYRSIRGMPDEGISRFPVFMRFGSLLTYGRTVWSLGSGAECEESDWAAALRQACKARLAQAAEEYERDPVAGF